MDGLKDRFESKYIPEPNSGCWLWEDSLSSDRYGKLKYKGKTLAAHRVSYELYKGKIPEGFYVCHTCDIPSCVNPNHLFSGTPRDNTKDMLRKGRNGDIRGEKNPRSKLTAREVKEIISRYSQGGITQKELGSLYGVGARHIRKLITKSSWGSCHE